MIRVRRATSDDVAAMSRVMIASITVLCAADHHDGPDAVAAWTANKTPAGVTAMLANPACRMFVAERDGEVAAVGAILGADEIGLNYVSPKHRFAGVSKALLTAMEDEMRRGGVAVGRLGSTATAHRFYIACNWQDVGEAQSGRFGRSWPMEKRL